MCLLRTNILIPVKDAAKLTGSGWSCTLEPRDPEEAISLEEAYVERVPS